MLGEPGLATHSASLRACTPEQNIVVKDVGLRRRQLGSTHSLVATLPGSAANLMVSALILAGLEAVLDLKGFMRLAWQAIRMPAIGERARLGGPKSIGACRLEEVLWRGPDLILGAH